MFQSNSLSNDSTKSTDLNFSLTSDLVKGRVSSTGEFRIRLLLVTAFIVKQSFNLNATNQTELVTSYQDFCLGFNHYLCTRALEAICYILIDNVAFFLLCITYHHNHEVSSVICLIWNENKAHTLTDQPPSNYMPRFAFCVLSKTWTFLLRIER